MNEMNIYKGVENIATLFWLSLTHGFIYAMLYTPYILLFSKMYYVQHIQIQTVHNRTRQIYQAKQVI